MYSSFTASTAWKLERPKLSQRRAPLTLTPMPGTNTSRSSTKHASSSHCPACSTGLSSVRITQPASTMPAPRNTRCFSRKWNGPTPRPSPIAIELEATITTPKQASAMDTPSSHGS